MKANLPKGCVVSLKGINLTLTSDTEVEVDVDTKDQLAETLCICEVLEFNDNLSAVLVDETGQKVRVFYGAKGVRIEEKVEEAAPKAKK